MVEQSMAARIRKWVVNPVVSALLRSPAHRLLSGSLLVLTYRGRSSGRRYRLPVMYAVTGPNLVVVAGQHRGKGWWRNFGTEPQPVTVVIRGRREEFTVRRLALGLDECDRALRDYQRRYPSAALEPDAPVFLLTRSSGTAEPDAD